MTDTSAAQSTTSRVNLWRIATIICLLALIIGATTGISMYEVFKTQIIHLQTKLKQVPQIRYVAVLLDARHTPGMLVTYDPQDGFLQLQRLTDLQEGRDDSMQLWSIGAAGQAQSLGVLTPKLKTVQLPIGEKALAGIGQLAISVENRGGVEPGSAPRLPYLYTGTLIKKAL